MAGREPERNELAALGEQLRKHTEGTPEREKFLEKLAEDIKAGRYNVDPNTLAQKLIDEALRIEPKPAGRDRRRRPPPSQ